MDCQQWENPQAHWSEHSPMFVLWVCDDTFDRVRQFVAQPHRGTLRTSMDLSYGRRRASWYAFVFEGAPEAAMLFKLQFEQCHRMRSVEHIGGWGYTLDFNVEAKQQMWRV